MILVDDVDDPAEMPLQCVSIYRRRHILLRADLLPFALLHTLLLLVFLFSPVHEETATYALPLGVLMHLVAFLSTHWSVSFRCALQLTAVSSPALATLVCVHPRAGGRPTLCPIARRERGGKGEKGDDGKDAAFAFTYLQRSYVITASGAATAATAATAAGGANSWRCEPLRMPVSETHEYYLSARGYHDAASLSAARTLYGRNACPVPRPAFGSLLAEHALAPFFVFQLLCVLLWSLDEYWYYSVFTLLMLIVFESTVVHSRLRNIDEVFFFSHSPPFFPYVALPFFLYITVLVGFRSIEMREYSGGACAALALRAGKWQRLSSEDLLPGDLVSLSRSPSAYGDSVETVCPADVLLLHGSLVSSHPELAPNSPRTYPKRTPSSFPCVSHLFPLPRLSHTHFPSPHLSHPHLSCHTPICHARHHVLFFAGAQRIGAHG